MQFLQNTVPFDDTVPLEDAFETQLVNLGGETQVLDDPDCTENIRTQLLDGFDDEVVIESDGEGTDRTEVLSDNEGLSDDNSVRSIGVFPVDKENVHHVSACEQGEKGSLLEPHPLIGEQCNAGMSVLNSIAIWFVYYFKIFILLCLKAQFCMCVFLSCLSINENWCSAFFLH